LVVLCTLNDPIRIHNYKNYDLSVNDLKIKENFKTPMTFYKEEKKDKNIQNGLGGKWNNGCHIHDQ
jgi:hypothetical protein